MGSRLRCGVLSLVLVAITGCGDSPPPADDAAAPGRLDDAAVETPGVPEANLAQWARSCALCHVRGEGGAPPAGDAEAWAPRLAKGEDTLMRHTIEGFNNMPPLGYCMDCSREDFQRLIRFMAGDS